MSSLEDSILIGPTGGPEETAGGGGSEGVVSPGFALLGVVSPGVVSLRVVSPGVVLLGVVSPGVAEDVFFPSLSFFLISALKSESYFISLAALITFCSARLNIEKRRLLPVIKGGKSDLQSPARGQRVRSGQRPRVNRPEPGKICNHEKKTYYSKSYRWLLESSRWCSFQLT